MMRSKIVAGNWKMNGNLVFASEMISAFKEKIILDEASECIVFPPAVYLQSVSQQIEGSAIKLGAQNMHPENTGAYTGEVSALMLKELGCSHVMVGHSERRALFGESDAFIFNKFRAAKSAGLCPILCVGETLEDREAGRTEAVLLEQLTEVLKQVDCLKGAIVAYEPVWAIGTGKTATPNEAQVVHAFIRQQVAEKSRVLADTLPLLYGGSVNAANANALFAEQDIDGGLIGGASLKIDEFVEIVSCIKSS